jgi:hypothetical protein
MRIDLFLDRYFFSHARNESIDEAQRIIKQKSRSYKH